MSGLDGLGWPNPEDEPKTSREREASGPSDATPCSADEAHRHLYHPWWSVKEMEAIATLAHRHHMNPVELIRDAVGGWDQAWQICHSARYILEDANPEKLAEACGLETEIPLWQHEGFPSPEALDEWFGAMVNPGQTITKTLMRFRLLNDQILPPAAKGKDHE